MLDSTSASAHLSAWWYGVVGGDGGRERDGGKKNTHKINSRSYPESFCLLTPQIATAERLELCDDAS